MVRFMPERRRYRVFVNNITSAHYDISNGADLTEKKLYAVKYCTLPSRSHWSRLNKRRYAKPLRYTQGSLIRMSLFRGKKRTIDICQVI